MAITIESIFSRLRERLAGDTRPSFITDTHYLSSKDFLRADIVPAPPSDNPPVQGCIGLFSGQYLLVTTDGSRISLEHPTGDFVYDFSAEYADPVDIEEACDMARYFIEHEHLPKRKSPLSVPGSRNTPLGNVITVQDAIDLLLQAPDKSAPLLIDSNRFFSKLSLSHPDNCVRLDTTTAPYINSVSYGYPKTPTQYYRTNDGGSFDAVQLESGLKGDLR